MVGEERGLSNGVRVRSPVPIRPSAGGQFGISPSASVHIVDDDTSVREALGNLLRSIGYHVMLHSCAAEFLNVDAPNTPACLLLDIRLPGISGLQLQECLNRCNVGLPVILMTAFGDVPMSVKGMKAGAIDFLTKPIRDQDLLDAVAAAVRVGHGRRQEIAQTTRLREQYARLTERERQVVALVAAGLMNKQIANELSISEVTVKMHRGTAMRKLGVTSVARLARIAEILDIHT
jgi:FixJ family two-component response regulator